MNKSMSDLYTLNKLLIKYDPQLTVISSGKYSDDILSLNDVLFKKIITVVNKICELSSDPKKDLSYFLKGLILSKPYKQKKFMNKLDESLDEKFLDISSTVDSFLEQELEKNDENFYFKLKNFKYKISEGNYSSITSRNPLEIKKYVDKTNSCASNSPLEFFSQIVSDSSTMYLLTKKTEYVDLDKVSKSQAEVAYARIYLFQDESKEHKFFAVDNIWFNNNNRLLVNHVLDQLVNIGNYFNLPIFDVNLTKEFIDSHADSVKVLSDGRYFYKAGRIPVIERYFHMRVDLEDGVYCINPHIDNS